MASEFQHWYSLWEQLTKRKLNDKKLYSGMSSKPKIIFIFCLLITKNLGKFIHSYSSIQLNENLRYFLILGLSCWGMQVICTQLGIIVFPFLEIKRFFRFWWGFFFFGICFFLNIKLAFEKSIFCLYNRIYWI